MADKEKIDKLVQQANQIIPYVLATIGQGNTRPAGDNAWTEVHTARLRSCEAQLAHLLKNIIQLKAG